MFPAWWVTRPRGSSISMQALDMAAAQQVVRVGQVGIRALCFLLSGSSARARVKYKYVSARHGSGSAGSAGGSSMNTCALCLLLSGSRAHRLMKPTKVLFHHHLCNYLKISSMTPKTRQSVSSCSLHSQNGSSNKTQFIQETSENMP